MKSQSRQEIGIARIIFFLALFFVLPIDRMVGYTLTPDWLQCAHPDQPWIQIKLSPLQAAWIGNFLKLSLLTSALGLYTASSYWISLCSLSLLMIYWSQFCYTTHELTPLPIALLIWALMDKDSAFRISERIFPKKQQNYFKTSGWTLNLLKVHFCLAFFSAGFSKLKNGGLEWMQDPSLKNILVLQNFLFEGSWLHSSFPRINYWLTSHPFLCAALSAVVVGLEILAFLALPSRKAALVIVPCLALMQIGILIVVYINFVTWIPLYLIWLPLGKLFIGDNIYRQESQIS